MPWPPRRILVGTDFSESADAALRAAARIAWRVGASLDLLHALSKGTSRDVDKALDARLARMPEVVALRERVRAQIEALARDVQPEPRLHVALGPAPEELIALRQRVSADLVVLGAGTGGINGVRHFLFGSVADRLLRRPGCPLLLVKDAAPAGEFKKILVAQEFPERATPWLELGLHLAHVERSEVVLLHVLPPKGYASDAHHVDLEPERAPEKLDRLLARVDPTIPALVDVRQGDAAHEIIEAARAHGVHLVVLGAERNRDGWPGRVADRVARAGLPAALFVWPERESSEDFDVD